MSHHSQSAQRRYFPLFRLHCDCSFLTCPAAVDDKQAEAKAEPSPPPSKTEPPIVAETKAQDVAAPNPPSGKKKNSAKKQKTEPGTAKPPSPEFKIMFIAQKHICKSFSFSWGSECLG